MAIDGHHATFFAQLIGWNQHRSPDRIAQTDLRFTYTLPVITNRLQSVPTASPLVYRDRTKADSSLRS